MKSATPTTTPTLIVDAAKRPESVRVCKTKLLVISGPLQGREFVLDRPVFAIGSGERNDLRLQDPAVSRRHCEIRVDETGYAIEDLGSTNGTFVQGIRVRQAFLHPGAELTLGKTKLVFCPLQEAQDIALSPRDSFGAMLGGSVAMRRVFHLAETYAPTDATVFITGETGTGKDLLAEEIHRHSRRRDRPFHVIDCATLSRDLVEMELFGQVRGAFPGATEDRVGVFEHADGGTVFLDEVGNLPPDLQPKLLRVLEKREIRRVGDSSVRKIDVRILCASNRRMDVEVNEGRFREDLFYRLSVVPIELPPLRRRREDIPALLRRFIVELHGEEALAAIEDFDGAMEILMRHEWPGNVRELRNLAEIAFYGDRRPIRLDAFLGLPGLARPNAPSIPPATADRPFKDAKNALIGQFEVDYIRDLLRRNGGNVSRSAREAGIERAYLQRLLRKYGIHPDSP